MPIVATSCFSTEAPFPYVIPSKFRNVSSVSRTVPAMGCVVMSWSWR